MCRPQSKRSVAARARGDWPPADLPDIEVALLPPSHPVRRREQVRDVSTPLGEHVVDAAVLHDGHVLDPPRLRQRVAGQRVHTRPSGT